MLDANSRSAIEALLVRYATAADERDAAQMESCFTPDVTADYGEQIGKFASRQELVGHLTAMLGGCGPTLHFISNIVLTPVDGGIKSKCYTHAVVWVPGMEAPMRTAGTYEDLIVEGGDGWRIKRRIYTTVA